MATQADQIRKYILTEIVELARQAGRATVTVRAGGIHDALGLQQRLPLVSTSLDAEKFLSFAKVRLIERTGPKQGSNAEWVFAIQLWENTIKEGRR